MKGTDRYKFMKRGHGVNFLIKEGGKTTILFQNKIAPDLRKEYGQNLELADMAKRLASQLFVSRLSFYTTNQDLRRLFSPFGGVIEARLVKDPRTQRPKGFGFVTFEKEIEAQKAVEAMNGRIVNGRLILVEVAKPTNAEEGVLT